MVYVVWNPKLEITHLEGAYNPVLDKWTKNKIGFQIFIKTFQIYIYLSLKYRLGTGLNQIDPDVLALALGPDKDNVDSSAMIPLHHEINLLYFI